MKAHTSNYDVQTGVTSATGRAGGGGIRLFAKKEAGAHKVEVERTETVIVLKLHAQQI